MKHFEWFRGKNVGVSLWNQLETKMLEQKEKCCTKNLEIKRIWFILKNWNEMRISEESGSSEENLNWNSWENGNLWNLLWISPILFWFFFVSKQLGLCARFWPLEAGPVSPIHGELSCFTIRGDLHVPMNSGYANIQAWSCVFTYCWIKKKVGFYQTQFGQTYICVWIQYVTK